MNKDLEFLQKVANGETPAKSDKNGWTCEFCNRENSQTNVKCLCGKTKQESEEEHTEKIRRSIRAYTQAGSVRDSVAGSVKKSIGSVSADMSNAVKKLEQREKGEQVIHSQPSDGQKNSVQDATVRFDMVQDDANQKKEAQPESKTEPQKSSESQPRVKSAREAVAAMKAAQDKSKSKIVNETNLDSIDFEEDNIAIKPSVTTTIPTQSVVLQQQESTPVSSSAVEESIRNAEAIKKYKELLDLGAITEEEYNLKKAQLLGL